LFKSFAAQPRLAIVTETFVEAQSDIFHFFIVFFSVYVCMAVNAVLFFGQDSVDFSTIDRAFHSCFLVMYGDWDYDQMEQVGRVKASLWFWLFMIIVVLVLQNIMLAILMEAYTNVKAATKDAPTLASQVKKQIRRFNEARAKKRVRLNDIFDALLESQGGDEAAMLMNDDIVWADELEMLVPNLKETQAKRTLKDSQNSFNKKHDAPFTVTGMSPNLATCKIRMDDAAVCSAFTLAKLQEYDMVERPTEGFEEPIEAPGETKLQRSQTVENTGAAKGPAPPHHDDDFFAKKSQLKEGLDQIRRITQKSTVELSDAMEAVLGEEMQALERRQKEQAKTMEQMQASLQSLRSLAYKLSETCTEVRHLSAELAPPSGPATIVEEEAPDVGLNAALVDMFGEVDPSSAR